MRDYAEKILRAEAEEKRWDMEEMEENPLLRYSTSELKAELRRRKRDAGR